MSRKYQIGPLIEEITKSQKFLTELQRCVEGMSRSSQQKQQLPTFAFERAGKYPWSIVEGNLPVQGQKMIEEITELIGSIIDNNLHAILSRQFLNISNEILIIRDEITQFTKDEDEKMSKMRKEFAEQVELLKRKMIVQQNMGGAREKEFVRTRATGMLNSSVSSLYSQEGKPSQLKTEVDSLRKEVEGMRREVNKSEIVNIINDKIVYLQDHLKHEMMDFKIKIQSLKQKSEKNYHELSAKMGESNSKEHIAAEVKRAVKSHFKIYLQEINYCKSSIQKFEDSLGKLDKGLQEYVANQLKSLWVVVGNMKRRVESIEQSVNLQNESFMME